MKKYLALIITAGLVLATTNFVFSQDEEEQPPEYEMPDEGFSTELSPEQAKLAEAYAHKVNLNTAFEEDLLIIPGMTRDIARAIINYAERVGFQSLDDLKNIPGITADLIASMEPYVRVAPKEIIQPLSGSLRLRMIVPKWDSLSYLNETSPEYHNPVYFLNRTQVNYGSKADVGAIILHGMGSKGFDWQNIREGYLLKSWVSLRDVAGLDKLVIGNFALKYGQGLIFYNTSGNEGYDELFRQLKIRASGIEPDKGVFYNPNFLGVAANKSFNLFGVLRGSIDGFYSNKPIYAGLLNSDGSIGNNLEGYETDSLRDPVFSNTGEVDWLSSDWDWASLERLRVEMVGGHLTLNMPDSPILPAGQVGFTAYQNKYSRMINPSVDLGYYAFRGNENNVYGADYDWRIGRLNFYGELARAANFGQGLFSGVETKISDFNFWVQYHKYDPDYYNEYSDASTFNFAPDLNQEGINTGVEYRHRQGRAKIYYESGYWPWTQSAFKILPGPFKGQSIWLELEQRLSDMLTLYARQVESAVEDKTYLYSSPTYGSIYVNCPEVKHKTRLQITMRPRGGPQLRIRWDRTRKDYYVSDFDAKSVYHGNEVANLVFGELRYRPTSKLTLETRLTLFDDSGQNGIYISSTEPYWPGITSSFSPRFDDNINTGLRYYFLINHKLTRNTSVWLRYATTRNFDNARLIKTVDEATIEKIAVTEKHEFRLQYDYSF